MKRKIIAITLSGLFFLGMFVTIDKNQTNQDKNMKILKEADAKTVNCLLGGMDPCNLWPNIGEEWNNIYQEQPSPR